MTGISPYRLMMIFFGGLFISLAYGVVGFFLVWIFESNADANNFFNAYTSSFKTIISLGLIIGTALVVFWTQNDIPHTIRKAFTEEQLEDTDYKYYEDRFSDRTMSVRFSTYFIIVAFAIFWNCHFPLSKWGEALMLIAVCAEYAFAVYVGRKLMNAGMMLHSLMTAEVPRNLFKKRELDEINNYVNVASTLTIIFVYVHFTCYYGAPFDYDRIVKSIKPFIMLLPLIATPVLLIFNFYPRAVLRKLYNQSIDVGIQELRETLKDEKLSAYERRSYIIEFEKMSRDELRYNLQLTLTDLPIGITILVMVLETLLKR